MKKLSLMFLLCSALNLNADPWSTAQEINITPSTGVGLDITLTYDPAIQSVIAAWGNNSSGESPYFSIYNGTSWGTAAAIPKGVSSGVGYNVALSYDAANQTVIAAWGDISNQHPFYSVYTNGTGWSVAAAIPPGPSVGVFRDIALTYDTNAGTVIAAWASSSAGQAPYYSVYNGSWGTAAAIPEGGSAGVARNVSLTYDANAGTVIAAWTDNSVTRAAYYSVYNGSWGTTTTIPLSPSTGVYGGVNLTYDAANQTVVAAWADQSTQAPYYSIYNGTSWSTAAPIPKGVSQGVLFDVSLSYQTSDGTVFAAWPDSMTHAPYYSIYNGTSWTTAALIPEGNSAGVNRDISLVFDAANDTTLAAWPDSILVYYSVYSSLLPPQSLIGSQKKNDFGLVCELFNTIQWQASPSADVVGYFVYRNGNKIATLYGPVNSYKDHNRKKNVIYSYSVTGFDSSFTESAPISLTIP